MTRNTVLSRERGLSFHQFPTDTIQRSKWIRAVNRTDPRSKKIWIPGPGAMLCSIHFQESDFESYNIRRKLKKGAVPSVSLYKVLQGCSDGKGTGDTSRRRQHEVYISASFIFQPTDCLLL
uniref:THAP domain-containing protein 1 n=1 Tax=Moschus moschiferus TaxID=68415 RepID=A0A8C6DGW2_MOSMO